MLQKWTAELPISDNLEWCYNGKFYENLDGFSFFYRDSKCLIGLQFSKDGQLLYRAEEAMSKLDIPAYWMVSEQDLMLWPARADAGEYLHRQGNTADCTVDFVDVLLFLRMIETAPKSNFQIFSTEKDAFSMSGKALQEALEEELEKY